MIKINEYIMPVKYQNVGCGISVIVAGIEQSYGDYDSIGISIDDENYVKTEVDENNLDFSLPVTFDNLKEDEYCTVYAQLRTGDNITKLEAKILPQIQTVTVELSPEIKKDRLRGGGLVDEFIMPKEVI